MKRDESKELKELRKENKRLKKELDNVKQQQIADNTYWDFHYRGGDYEEEVRCFYGDFS